MRQLGRALIALAFLPFAAPGALAAGDSYFTLDPCRAVDTRSPATGGPAVLPGETVNFQLAGACGIPSDAKEVAINITAVTPTAGGFAVAFAGDATAPSTSVISFNAGKTRASNTIVQLASDGSGTMALLNGSLGTTHFVIDVVGYFLDFCPAITVSPTDPTLPAGTQGSPYSQTFTATGGTGPYTFAVTAGALPTPLNLDSGGDLSGTPTVAGDFSFTIAATDTVTNCTGAQAYTLHLDCGTLAVAITPTPAQVCTSSAGNGASATAGFASYSWLITNGTITSATNTQSITYTAGSSGNVGLTVNVTDASACPGQATLDVPIVANPSPPTITTGNPQTFTVSGAGGTFTLTFNGQTTSSLAFNSTAAQVQTALNALSSIGGAGGSAAVTLTGGFYTVTFGGTLAGPEPQLTASGSGGCTVVVDPPGVCSDSTGNQARGPAGAASYAWSITNGAITSATNVQTITYTAGSSGNVGLTLVVTTAAGCAASNSVDVPINANPATPTIAAGDSQTFTVSGASGTFTLTFNGQTTSSLAFDSTAAQVQTALNALSSVGGVGGSAAVSQVGNVYTLAFGGTLTGPQPQLTSSGAGGCTIVVDPPSVCANSTGNQASGPAGATTWAWSITNGTITSATDVQTITYSAGPSGNVGLTLTVTNASHCPAQGTLDVLIKASPATPTISPTPAQVCANSTGNSADGPAGAATYAWSISNGTITSATNVQTITYSAGASGNVGLTLTVTNAQGCSTQGTLDVPINPTPAFTPAAGALAVATFNVAYSLTFAGTGGTAPYSFVIASGALPTGMTLNSDGSVSPNTPSATGPFGFSITVTDANGCSSTQAYTLNVQPKLTAKAYTDVGNTQLAGGVVAPSTPSVSVVAVSSGDTSDTTITYAVTVAPTNGALTTFSSNGTFLYTPNAGNTTSDAFTYTGTSNGVSATQTATIAFTGMVWWVDNTNGGTADGRSNTPFTTMTQANSAATSNGDFIYVFKGTGTTTGAYTMKTSQKLIGAGATLNVPTVGPLVTIAGVAGNTPTIGGTLTLASSVTVDGIDMSTGASNAITGTSVTGINVTARDVTTTTGTAVNIGGAGNSGTMTFQSVSSTGAGSTPGISLSNTTGTFTVTGDGGGSNNGSGGTISSKVGNSEATGTPGVRLNNVTNVRLKYMNLTGNNHSGIYGTTVNGFQLDHCTITGNGNDTVSSPDELGVDLYELTGTAIGGSNPTSITNTTISNNWEFELQITNTTGTLTDFQLTNCTISSNGATGAHGNLVNFLASGTATMTLNATGGTYTGAAPDTATAIQADASGGSVTANVSGATFTNNNAAVSVSAALNGNLTFDVFGNTATGNRSHGLNLFIAANTTGLTSGKFRNNVVGTLGVAGSGSDLGFGIRVQNESSDASSPATVLISGNTVQELTNFAAINVNQGIALQPGSRTTNVSIIGNVIKNVNNSRAIIIQQNNSTAPGMTCADVSGNDMSGIAGNVGDGTKIRLRQLAGGTFNVRQKVASAASDPLELDDANSVGANVTTPAQISVSGTVNFNAGTCPQP